MRASRSQWSVSPETIMSHHFRLAKGVPAVVDAAPPYSMYNSVHYSPLRRSSSADFNKRKILSKSQKELNDFVNGRKNGGGGLRLPLPIRSSLTDLTKPKLLENRNYQPPRRRQNTPKPVELNPPELQKINKFIDEVLSDIIQREDFSDKMIMNTIRRHMESSAGIIPWNELENAESKLLNMLNICKTKNRNKENISRHSESRLRTIPIKLDNLQTDQASCRSTDLSDSSKSSSTSFSSSSTNSSSGSL